MVASGHGPKMDFGKNKIKQLQRRLKRDPNSYEANLQLGLAYLKRGETNLALRYLEKASSVDEENPRLSFILANVYKTVSDLPKSEKYFRKALRLDPENIDFLYQYALMLAETRRTKEAIELLEKGIKMSPNNPELWNDLGVLYFQVKDTSKAERCFKRAMEINEDYHLPAINLGHLLISKNDIYGAREMAERLKALLPDDAEVRELEEQISALSGNTQVAREGQCVSLSFSDKQMQIAPLEMVDDFSEDSQVEDVDLSVVIPVMNEKENIPILYEELRGVLEGFKPNYELIFVDDGSTDGTTRLLEEIARRDEKLKVIRFRRNYGQTAALAAGFKYSKGKIVVTMDGDLQNDPADIPKLLEKMAEGYDLVSGWRKDRKDAFLTRKIPSILANRIINKLIEGTGIQLHDYGCTLKAYKRGIIKNISLYGEMHRFIPVFAAWLGVKVTEIPVNHRPRVHGAAKYNLSRVSRVIFDLMVVRFFSDYMTRPIQFFGKMAKFICGVGTCIIVSLAGLSIGLGLPISLNTLAILGALLMIAVLQIVSMGLLGEIMIRAYFEGQKKDAFVVERVIEQREEA